MPDDRNRKETETAAFAMFSAACTSLQLTDQQTIIIAAQFLGRVIAKTPAPQSHPLQLQVAAGAMLDAHRTAIQAQATIRGGRS